MSSHAMADFSAIKFDKNKTEILINLVNFFDAVVTHQGLDVGYKELEQIICSELNIDLNGKDDNVKIVLAESLMYYMTVWPGWQRFDDYYRGDLSHKDWFERFRQYLILKERYVFYKSLEFAENAAADKINIPKGSNMSIQTEVEYNTKQRIYAPYSMYLAGPAPVLNNVVFVKQEGNIVIKQFPIRQWQPLKVVELMNWPNVSVELRLLDIFLTRSVTHKTIRYMAFCDDIVTVPETEHVIYTKKITESGKQKSFSYELIDLYFEQLYKTLEKIPGVNLDRITEIQTLLSQFLQDIADVALFDNTMCTNMSVGYHMGKSMYVRSRKMMKSTDDYPIEEVINFYEVVKPQIDFSLHTFSPELDDEEKANVTFKNVHRLGQSLKTKQESDRMKNLINDCLTYKCTGCHESFTGVFAANLLLKHFEIKHRGEQNLLCHKCHKESKVTELASARWYHPCTA